jgi:hypothetical protein
VLLDGRSLLQQVLDAQALDDIYREVQASMPRGDRRAKLSAFLSEVAATDLSRYFRRWLE